MKALRLKNGYSVSELARRCGMTREYLRMLEMEIPPHRVTLESAERIARALGSPLWKMIKF